MSKIYQALSRHKSESKNLSDSADTSRSPISRALDSIYPSIYRLVQQAGHGLVLHFVAPTPGEGATTISGEFSRVASRVADASVLLLDADRIQLTSASLFGCPTDFGIFDHVKAGKQLDDKIVVSTNSAGLHAGVLCGVNSPPLSRNAVPAIYQQFRERYQITVVDCPSVSSDRYFELSPEAADGVILIVQAEKSRPEIIRHAKTLIENAGGNLIGSILNQRKMYIPNFLYRLL
jgi:Mrp family chromosome partitioning ATPase